jgi:GNAT superfamily N-acetyltransferase
MKWLLSQNKKNYICTKLYLTDKRYNFIFKVYKFTVMKLHIEKSKELEMNFRQSVKEDIEDILIIIKQAQASLKEAGINQWQNNYPNYETISRDIDNNESYVLLEGNEVVGTTAISFRGEKTYQSIYEGQWVSDSDYAVIHRIAVNHNYKGTGLASKIINYVEEICLDKGVISIKVDTHEKNLSMQRLLGKNNFQYCGIIYLDDGSKRIAFEKICSNLS